MNVRKSLEYLKNYVDENIDTSTKQQEGDYGCRALMIKVEQDYNYDLGLNPNKEPVEDLIDATFIGYNSDADMIVEFADRNYISDVFLKRNIDTEKYVNNIKKYRNLILKDGGLTTADSYECTHWVWALYIICKDNNILHHYSDLMSETLINLYLTLPPCDVKTECLTFLSMIDVSRIKKEWIKELEDNQLKDGTFKSYTSQKDIPKYDRELYTIHHICLALIALYNYYNVIRIN